ncbi:hypothetical protein PTKIN_Ptkin01aG0081500 [Pterospermum kingtungense]
MPKSGHNYFCYSFISLSLPDYKRKKKGKRILTRFLESVEAPQMEAITTRDCTCDKKINIAQALLPPASPSTAGTIVQDPMLSSL